MDVSVIIPTRGRAAMLGACIARLARQMFDAARFEVLVGVDGPDGGETRAGAEAAKGRIRVVIHEFAHGGPAATRNRLIEHARGAMLLLLNDDVLAEPDLIEVHAREQRALGGEGAMILGAAPWVVREADRLFDRLVRETSMVFFYDQMVGERAADPGHDWGFRHAWTLNLSVPAAAVRAVGGFNAAMGCACYEDIELAWRLAKQSAMPVLYRPAAVATHDHRYEPMGYLRREAMLGEEAWRLAHESPECARQVFGRDVRSHEETGYCKAFVERERRAAERGLESFRSLARIPASAVDGAHSAALVRLIYEQHLPLKRWVWRCALLDAAMGRSVSPLQEVLGAGEA